MAHTVSQVAAWVVLILVWAQIYGEIKIQQRKEMEELRRKFFQF